MSRDVSIEISPYASLRAEIEGAARVLSDAFRRADDEALRYQRNFRRSELAIIYGGVVAVGLGLAAGLFGAARFSFAEVALTAALGSLAFVSRGLRWQGKWLRHRLVAETLRGERILFIGRMGEYANAAEPERVLERRAVEIERLGSQEEGHG